MGRSGQTLIDLPGIHTVRIRRAGKPDLWYIYAWRGGPCIRKAQGPNRPGLTREDMAAFESALAASQKVKTDTLAGLIRQYRKSPEWNDLAPGTRRVWTGHLDRIEARWAETPLSFWSDPRMIAKVVAWRDSRADTPRSADIGITVLKHLLNWARLRGRVTTNLALGIPALDRGASRAEIIWLPEDLEALAKHASQQVMDGVHLARLTGLRRQDLVRVTFDLVGENAIILTALKSSRKRRRRVVIPILPELAALLDQLRSRKRKPGVETLLVNGAGESWSADGFGQRFIAARDKAGIVHRSDDPDAPVKPKHLHDLRGTYATDWMKATPRLTDLEIAELLGWSPKRVEAIRRRYVDEATIVVALAERLRGKAL